MMLPSGGRLARNVQPLDRDLNAAAIAARAGSPTEAG
jgi:hypothetical protein